MAHQSGIRVSDGLAERFHSALSDAAVRAIKVTIAGEELEASGGVAAQGTLADDLARVPALLDATEPCYLLVRLDLAENDGAATSRWLLAAYLPDAAHVRAKMLYASSKAALAKSLGESYFVDDMFGTTPDEFSPGGYQRHRRHVEAAAPLTEREKEMERIRDLESNSALPTMDSRRTHLSEAPQLLDPEAEEAMGRFATGAVNFVLLAIDMSAEAVKLVREDSLQSHDELARLVPGDTPSYVLYWYDSATSVFIYSCPSASSVRERMVYSTFRRGFTANAEKLGINMDIRFEFDSPADITAAALADEVAARTAPAPRPVAATQQKFKRPAPPSRRPRAQPLEAASTSK
ncbi:Twinfilin-1 [Coemansia biformis]|uniref:Twinfilin-1 n=1 Tax=Coemansia biformis TaxID=1286918 RepID=A0A9W8CPU8_9FUNG|nr:Twinfilin-1 [Coemansia biformis]